MDPNFSVKNCGALAEKKFKTAKMDKKKLFCGLAKYSVGVPSVLPQPWTQTVCRMQSPEDQRQGPTWQVGWLRTASQKGGNSQASKLSEWLTPGSLSSPTEPRR